MQDRIGQNGFRHLQSYDFVSESHNVFEDKLSTSTECRRAASNHTSSESGHISQLEGRDILIWIRLGRYQ